MSTTQDWADHLDSHFFRRDNYALPPIMSDFLVLYKANDNKPIAIKDFSIKWKSKYDMEEVMNILVENGATIDVGSGLYKPSSALLQLNDEGKY